jgi:hypothetical protein
MVEVLSYRVYVQVKQVHDAEKKEKNIIKPYHMYM